MLCLSSPVYIQGRTLCLARYLCSTKMCPINEQNRHQFDCQLSLKALALGRSWTERGQCKEVKRASWKRLLSRDLSEWLYQLVICSLSGGPLGMSPENSRPLQEN